VYELGAFNECAHYGNIPCPYTKNWPEAGSLETKYVANYVLTIYIYILYVVFG